jgi:hypothetical protein
VKRGTRNALVEDQRPRCLPHSGRPLTERPLPWARRISGIAPKERQSLSQGVPPWRSLLCVFVPWWLILFSVPLCLCGENSVSWWCGLGDVLEMCHLLELFVAQLDFGEGEFLESIKREFLHTKTGHDRTEDDGLPNGWNITPVHTR